MNVRSFINFGEASSISIGVNVEFGEAFVQGFSYCIVRTKQNTAVILNRGDRLQSPEEVEFRIRDFLKEGARMHINFVGNGLLSKESVSASGDLIQETRKLFPFLKAEEMLIQRFTNDDLQTFYTVIGNDSVQAGMPFTGLGRSFIYSLSLGPFILSTLRTMIPEGSFSAYGYQLIKRNPSLAFKAGVADHPELSLKIEDHNLGCEGALAYASALAVFIPNENIVTSEFELAKNGKIKFDTWNSIYQTSKIAAVVTLVALCINAVVYFSLQQQTSDLAASVQFSAGVTEKTQQTNTYIRQLVTVYKQLGWQSNMLPLYYADQIAQTVDEDMKLINLHIGTLDAEMSRSTKASVFQSDKISVTGVVKNSFVFDAWLKRIEGLAWVKKASDRIYQYDDKLNKARFNVTIEINGTTDNP